MNFKISDSPTNTENYQGSMENQLSSSGIFSQDTQHCRFSKRSKKNLTLVKQVQNNLKIESSSCQRSTILIGQRKQILDNVFRIPKRSSVTQKGFRVDICHFLVWEKTKKGRERTPTHLKDSGI